MSGRIRTIKPELLEDAVTAGLSSDAFRLFVGVILLADDPGNFRAEPAWLNAQVFWKRSAAAPVELLLEELAPLVHFYEVGGQRYGAVRNWKKHQRISHPAPGKVPPPPEDLRSGSGAPPEPLRSHSPQLSSPPSIPPEPLRPDLDQDLEKDWEGKGLGGPRAGGAPAPAESVTGVRAKPGAAGAETIPEDFAVTQEDREYAKMHGLPSPDGELLAFVNDRRSRGAVSTDWRSAFRKWLADARRFAASRPPPGGRPAEPDHRHHPSRKVL